MKLLKQRDKDGSFTVPHAFTDVFLGVLSGDAVKLYLYIKRCFAEGNEYYVSDASETLRMGREACENALEELEVAGIIVTDGEEITLAADSALREAYANRADAELRKKLLDRTYGKEFKEAVSNINNEFFAGTMNQRWYDLVRKCAGEYGFQPETIYILFASCKGIRDKSPKSSFYNYVAKVAENWYADKVVTPEDVAEREKKASAAREYSGFIKKKLNFTRPFTEQENNVIACWQEKGITPEMLAVLLDDTNRVSAFTISKIDTEAGKWAAAGLKTPEEVKAYYENIKAAKKAERNVGNAGGRAGKGSKAPDPQKHYGGERKYDEDFFAWLENRDNGGDPKTEDKT